jgi:hypothetical protein
MKTERTLAFQLAKKISLDDARDISAAGGWTTTWTANVTHTPAGMDGQVDVTWDF